MVAVALPRVSQAFDANGLPLEATDAISAFIIERVQWANRNGQCITIRVPGNGKPFEVFKNNKRMLVSARNWIYLQAVLGDFDYYFDAIEPELSEGFETADYSTPRWHTIKGVSEPYFFTSFAEGWFESGIYLEHLAPKSGDVVLDLGAYCGLSAMTFAKSVGATGRVLAFEPDPDNHASFLRNLKAYHHPNITLVNKAIWGIPQKLSFSCEGNMGSSIVEICGSHRGRVIEIEGTTIPDIVKDYQLQRVDIVKMDIEGAEYSALDTSADFIKTMRAKWIIEVHDETPGGQPNFERIRKYFERSGYHTFRVPRDNGDWFPLICARPN